MNAVHLQFIRSGLFCAELAVSRNSGLCVLDCGDTVTTPFCLISAFFAPSPIFDIPS